MREITRMVGVSVGNVRRELMILESAGILRSNKRGNLKFFSLDRESPLYRPFCELVIKTAGIPALLKELLRVNKNIIASFIYGSFARGDFDNRSDIDLFVLTDRNSSVFEKISEAIDRFEHKFDREVNVSLVEEKEFFDRLRHKDSYLLDITKGKKIFLKGGENDLGPKSGGAPKG